MENTPITMPAHRVCEYLLVLQPHPVLSSKIMIGKKAFAEKYAAPSAFSKPHITLMNFTGCKAAEGSMIKRIATVAICTLPFDVELHNFGTFAPHTIYINVHNKNPVRELVQALNGVRYRQAQFGGNPHLTICRGLTQWQHSQSWPQFARRSFSANFFADGMLLLRRPAGEMRFQQAAYFPFLGRPKQVTQGKLFG